MSGYRDELGSALRQVDELREEARRLRAELDETRAAGGSSLANALVAWRHARASTRAALFALPLALTALVGGAWLAARRFDARREPSAPAGLVEPLTGRAATPICPPQRPCPELHAARDDVRPTTPGRLPAVGDDGLITEGPFRGIPFLGPQGGGGGGDGEGTLVLDTREEASCAIGPTMFPAPATVRLPAGDYDLHCASRDGLRRKRWRVRIASRATTESWREDLDEPRKRGAAQRPTGPSEWVGTPRLWTWRAPR